jgi:hypothetical protein
MKQEHKSGMLKLSLILLLISILLTTIIGTAATDRPIQIFNITTWEPWALCVWGSIELFLAVIWIGNLINALKEK